MIGQEREAGDSCAVGRMLWSRLVSSRENQHPSNGIFWLPSSVCCKMLTLQVASRHSMPNTNQASQNWWSALLRDPHWWVPVIALIAGLAVLAWIQ